LTPLFLNTSESFTFSLSLVYQGREGLVWLRSVDGWAESYAQQPPPQSSLSTRAFFLSSSSVVLACVRRYTCPSTVARVLGVL
jgi:hypothetical protein